jgi:O-antigen ligase
MRSIIQIINLVLLIYFFISEYGLRPSKFPIIPNSIRLFIFFLLTSILLSTLVNDYIDEGILFFIRTALFFLIIYLIFALIKDEQDIKILLSALFITGTALFILIFYYLSMTGFNIINFSQSLELMGEESYIHKNSIGAFFVIIISIMTAYLFNVDNKKRVFTFIGIIIFIIGLVITNSRGSIASLLISSLYIIYKLNRRALIKIIAILCLILPLIFIDPIYHLLELYLKVDMVASGRDYILEATFNIIKSNPIFGIGPTATSHQMYTYLPFMLGSSQEIIFTRHFDVIQYGHAHNFYLFYYTDLGLPGFILSIALPVIFLSISNNIAKNFKQSGYQYYWLVVSIQAAGLALFIRGLFEWGGILTYGAITADLPFWWIFCILLFFNNSLKNA